MRVTGGGAQATANAAFWIYSGHRRDNRHRVDRAPFISARPTPQAKVRIHGGMPAAPGEGVRVVKLGQSPENRAAAGAAVADEIPSPMPHRPLLA